MLKEGERIWNSLYLIVFFFFRQEWMGFGL